MKKLALTLLSISISAVTHAGELGQPGFDGEVTGMVGFSSGKSNFNTDTESKTGDLNTEAESESEALVAPLGQVRYTFGEGNNHQVFFGTSREDVAVGDFVLEGGYKFGFGEKSSLAFSYLPSLGGETWEDPYVTGKRETTGVSSSAFRVKYDSILDSNFSADVAYYTYDVDSEKSGTGFGNGTALSSLDRNGNGIYSKFSYTHFLDDTSVLEPSVLYKSFSADGSAMSNKAYGFELAYKKHLDRHAFVLSADYTKTSYDSTNAVFNKTQEDSEYGVFAAYEYDKFMGWDSVAFNAISGYEVKSSNIDFYNENEILVGVGLTYKF